MNFLYNQEMHYRILSERERERCAVAERESERKRDSKRGGERERGGESLVDYF